MFVARCVQLYLQGDGRFAFVLALAALSRRQFAGFRSGRFEAPSGHAYVAFDDAPWDHHSTSTATCCRRSRPGRRTGWRP